MAKRLEYEIQVDSSDGVKGLKQFSSAAKKELKSVSDELEDTRTNGAKVADVLAAMADQMDADLKRAAVAAEALSTALGPELTGRANVGALVADLNKMGLSFEEITADADRLASSIKQLDDVQMSGLKSGLSDVETSVGRIGTEADRSGGVMANMAGNAAQDIGQLAGVTGSAGVAIGQLAEYATEGGISLGNLVKVAGPMLGLAAATQVFADAVGGIKAEEAFRAELVDEFTAALQEGKTAAQEMLETVKETGELVFETGLGGGGGLLGVGSKTKDLIPIFEDLGFETREWLTLLRDPRRAADRFIAKAEEIGYTNVRLATRFLDAAEGLDQYADSVLEAGEKHELIVDINDALNDSLESTSVRAREAAAGWTEVENAAIGLGVGLNRMSIAGRDALADVETSADDAADAINEVEFAADAAGEGFDRLRKQVAMEGAVDDFKVDFLTAIAKTQEGVGLTEDEILGLKNSILEVAEYANLNPVQVQSLLDAVDQGAIEGVMQLVQTELDKNPAQWRVDLVLGRISPDLASIRQAERAIRADAGTPSMPRPGGIAGERGPEILDGRYLTSGPTWVSPGTRVTSRRQTARILRTRVTRGLRKYDSGGTVPAMSTTNVNLHLPAGANGADVVRQVNRWQRRNGSPV